MEDNYQIVVIGDIRVQSVEDERISLMSVSDRARVESIWQDAQKQRKNELFNGTLPHYVSIEKDGFGKYLIKVAFIEYKLFFAQQQSDMDFGITPLGVSGMIVVEDQSGEHIVFAQRSESVTEYPLYWELVPSGSLDRECVNPSGELDFMAKLLSEFTEETGLSKDIVKKISAYAATLDKLHRVYDVCCTIRVKAKANFLFRSICASKEFRSFQVVPYREAQSFFKSHEGRIVPSSLALIAAYSQIKKR